MGTVNVVLGEDTRLNLILGQQLENAVTSVVFDFSAWKTTYGAGTLALSVQRPGDEMPYAVALTTSGTDATWSVTNLDTAYKGVGHIQLTYTVGTAIKKSVVYKFTVYESLGANGEYPSPGQTWQEEMEQEITDVKQDLKQTANLTIERTGNDFVWESGTFTSNGSNTDNSARARMKNPVRCDLYTLISASSNVEFVVGIYNADGTFAGYYDGSTLSGSGTWIESADVSAFNGYLFRIAIRSKSAPTSDIDPSDGNTEISLKSRIISEINDIENDINNNLYIDGNVRPTLTSGSFVNAGNGNINTSSGFYLTAPIPVKKGQLVKLIAKGYSTVVGMINTCNADNTSRTVKVASVDGTKRTYTYIVEEDGYICCSFGGASYSLSLSLDYYGLFDDVKPLDIIREGIEDVNITKYSDGYINATNNHFDSSNNFAVSNSVFLYKGQTVTLNASGYSTVVGMINIYDPVNDTYQTVVASVDGTYRTYTYTATANCYVRFSYSKGSTPTATITTSETESIRLVDIESDIEELQDAVFSPIEYPKMFSNVICIGDSLTYGYDGQTQLATNYPFYFSKLADVTVSNQGLTGRSTKDWWDELGSSYTHFADFDCAIIYLGTNGGLTDTVSTDCNASDYTQNADTNTGCYGKIIGKIKADAPNCKIFCVGGPAEYVRRTYNPIIEQIANLYNAAYLDMTDCILSDDGSTSSIQRQQYRPYDGIHYNRLGYFTFANMVYDYMKIYMDSHLSKYVS